MRKIHWMGLCMALAGLSVTAANVAAGRFGIDQRVAYVDSGIWKRRNQLLFQDAAALIVVAGALWPGDPTRLGHTCWQSVDSVALGTASAALKIAFSRARPAQTNNPNEWFRGRGHNSFPNREVARSPVQSHRSFWRTDAEHPPVYALELLPIYDAIAGVRVRAHWQSDVIVAFGLETALGCYAPSRPASLSVGAARCGDHRMADSILTAARPGIADRLTRRAARSIRARAGRSPRAG